MNATATPTLLAEPARSFDRRVRTHETYVGDRFDLLEARFKTEVGADDYRLRALVRQLEPLAGRRVLDLGCGKGRFASQLKAAGAVVVGMDLSAMMLAGAVGTVDRVRASARRLPFAAGAFDAVIAVEVFEHLAAIDEVLAEVAAVLKPGGVLAVIDKNAASWNRRRPWLPNLVVKRIDEIRGRWMYPARGPVRERWFWPGAFCRTLAPRFSEVRVEFLLAPDESESKLFARVPITRRMALWTARVPGGAR